MKSSCSCTRFISTRQKKLGDGAAQQERARTSLPRCDPARWQSAQKYGTWTHEHVVSDRTMQSTGSLSGAWTAWLERLPDLRPSPAAPKSSTPALETILQKPLNGGILMCRISIHTKRHALRETTFWYDRGECRPERNLELCSHVQRVAMALTPSWHCHWTLTVTQKTRVPCTRFLLHVGQREGHSRQACLITGC